MPRRIDYRRGNAVEWDQVDLDEPVYGEGEMREAEIARLSAVGKDLADFYPQFSTYGRPDPADRTAAMDGAHGWLSTNATGPWAWTEDWSNHGHHVDTCVYVERVTDQERFAVAFPDLFRYRPCQERDLRGIAVLRGALPAATSKESFILWCREHAGFEIVGLEGMEDGSTRQRVVVSHPLLREEFVARWGASCRSDGEGFVVEPSGRTRGNDPVVWLVMNAAIGGVGGNDGPDGFRYHVKVRYADIAAALTRDWGHVFKDSGDGRTFLASDYPALPEVGIPDSFIAYVEGRAETYPAPHREATPIGPEA